MGRVVFSALLMILAGSCAAKDKTYYLAIKEIMWDYAPSDLNIITGNRLSHEKISNIYSNMFLGKTYKKAVYREYTNSSFQTEAPRDPNLGFMGPTMRVETGDRIIVHLFNNASKNYSIHPHGVFYTKNNEGANYGINKTNGPGSSVQPGGEHTYVWEVVKEFGPTPDDPNCLTWAYHSHSDSTIDVHAGLIGAIIVCNPGTYKDDETRRDVDHEFVAMFFIPHERESPYFWENMRMNNLDEGFDLNDKLFVKGNKMHTVNGFMYGNTPGYDVCQGDTISWHIIGMGSNRDLHPIQFQGQTVLKHHHRMDAMIAIPATFATAIMKADNPGRWIIACKLYSHYTEGMTALMYVDPTCQKPNASVPSDSLTGKTREYFIAAEEVWWNYAPSNVNQLTGERLDANGSDSSTYFKTDGSAIGGVYKKAVYRGYENGNFTVKSERTADMGILGPPIVAEVGDTLKVLFKNKAAKHAFNLEPQGVYFAEANAVLPGQKHTYTWTLPDSVSPGENDPNCITYLYTSSLEYVADSNAGLVGPLVVCKKGTMVSEMAKRHKYLLVTIFEEQNSWYFNENMKTFMTQPVTKNPPTESNMMHSLNGLSFGNLNNLEVCTDQDTIFHLFAVGTKYDIHAIKFDGINVKINGISTGAINLFAHTSQTVNVRADEVGKGLVFCSLMDHIKSGLFAIYTAKNCNSSVVSDEEDSEIVKKSTVRQYYIAAEEVTWDYNPSEVNLKGQSIHEKENYGYTHLHRQPGKTIGSKYKKVLYFEYTDDTYTVKLSKPDHFGILGPAIRGEVGDTIRILFWNKANRPYNMHPWGAIDPESYEMGKNSVDPGKKKLYIWKIPESASPTGNQPSCLSFIYVSSVDRSADTADGLLGPLVVCKPGAYDTMEIDNEFFLLFHIVDENTSHYLNENIQKYIGADPEEFNKKSALFVESNKMKTINGYLFHVDGLTMLKDDIVRWHLIGWGNEKDYHSVHFHAHTFRLITDGSYRGDVFDVFPGFFGTVDMETVAVGEWLLHCHVFEHIQAGMETTYTVLEKEITPAIISQAKLSRSATKRDVCDMKKIGGKLICLCGGMDLKRATDLFGENMILKVRLPHGSAFSVSPGDVWHLDLSNNQLNYFESREILSKFKNLYSLDLSNNNLHFLIGNLISDNKLLKRLSLKNSSLFYVSKSLVLDNPYFDFNLLDLSENPKLFPSCLNQAFFRKRVLYQCLKIQQ